MPPKYVTTVRQLIYWEYAKLIARAATFEDNSNWSECSIPAQSGTVPF